VDEVEESFNADLDERDEDEENGGGGEGRGEGRGERGEIDEARKWSEGVLEKRHANHVRSMSRQLQREKTQHRNTTDMLRRTMSKLRAKEDQEERRKLQICGSREDRLEKKERETEWSNAKEKKVEQSILELRTTRARLGAMKEEHARLLEYLKLMGITAPGGDMSSSSAMRHTSGKLTLFFYFFYFFLSSRNTPSLQHSSPLSTCSQVFARQAWQVSVVTTLHWDSTVVLKRPIHIIHHIDALSLSQSHRVKRQASHNRTGEQQSSKVPPSSIEAAQYHLSTSF
jgi:hypothetical protein